MNDCLDENTLTAYVDGATPAVTRRDIQHHLSTCSECRTLLSDYALGLDLDDAAPAPHAPGERVGRYIIEALLGRGTMGTVYLAEDATLQRRVALKFINAEDAPASTSRAGLDGEAQALARLSHPNVVNVHELGVLDGQSYVAMEYIEGETLADWIASHSPRWPDVVDALIQAGEGLAAAHRAGIIHRDLKPSNVMVGADGRVRIVDFGLARVDGAATSARPDTTGHREPGVTVTSFAGTPAYMAPELAGGQSADPATDQYSLCVTAHEALLGVRPGGDAPAPRRRIPPAISNVISRGLAVDRADRFASVADLVLALQRGRRSLRRRWWTMSVVATVALLTATVALAAFVAGRQQGGPTPAASCSSGADCFATVWNPEVRAAFTASLRAKSVAAPTVDKMVHAIDRYADDWSAQYRAACLDTERHVQSAALLDRRMACLDHDLSYLRGLLVEVPELDRSRDPLAPVYALSDPAQCANKRGLLELQELPGDAATRARIATVSSRVAELRLKVDLGSHQQALPLLEALEDEAGELAYPPLRGAIHHELGRTLLGLDDLDGAASALHEALTDAESGGDARLKRAVALSLSTLATQREQVDDAERWLDYAVAVASRSGDDSDPAVAATFAKDRGGIAWRRGHFERARDHWLAALRLRQKTEADGSPVLASLHNNLGVAYKRLGDLASAHEHLEAALALRRAAYGEDHLFTATSLENMGNLLMRENRQRDAASHYEKALHILEQNVPAVHPRLAQAENDLAGAYVELYRWDEADQHYRRAIEISRSRGDAGARDAARALQNLARLEQLREHFATARTHTLESLELRRRTLGERHLDVGDSLLTLGRVETELRHWAAAETALRRSLSIVEDAVGARNPTVAAPLTALGALELRRGAPARAIEPLERALTLLDERPMEAAVARLRLAQALWRSRRDRERARGLLVEAYETASGQESLDETLLEELETWLARTRPKPAGSSAVPSQRGP